MIFIEVDRIFLFCIQGTNTVSNRADATFLSWPFYVNGIPFLVIELIKL